MLFLFRLEDIENYFGCSAEFHEIIPSVANKEDLELIKTIYNGGRRGMYEFERDEHGRNNKNDTSLSADTGQEALDKALQKLDALIGLELVKDAHALDSDVRSSLVDAFRSAQLRADAAVEYALAWYSYTVENALDAGNQADEGVYREDRTSVGILGAGGNVSIASANIFTANNAEVLKAVSAYALTPDIVVDIEVYLLNDDNDSSDDGSFDDGVSGNGHLDEGCTLIEKARSAGHAITSANLHLSGEYGRDIQIEIPVEGLEGRTVTVVSCSNGTPELLTAEIKNGHATFRLKEPAPFALLDGVYTQDQIAAMEKADPPEPTPPSQDSDQPEDQPEDQPSGQPQDQFKEQSSLVGFSDNRTTSAQTSDSGMNTMMHLVLIALIAVFVLRLARSRKC